ncbi:MAG: cold shock domain-containing protein [bacterium]|jgi:CspA family cold shock protein|nr:cold shock domain-containing protein [candidate division KSB1 bacterium]MDH7559559.1 cold shock domain-containing protein [bacterium]
MRRGRVKWFDAAKGYGFIEDEHGQEVFVHFTAIQEERFRTLEQGGEVYFASVSGEKGPKAIKVIKVAASQ